MDLDTFYILIIMFGLVRTYNKPYIVDMNQIICKVKHCQMVIWLLRMGAALCAGFLCCLFQRILFYDRMYFMMLMSKLV